MHLSLRMSSIRFPWYFDIFDFFLIFQNDRSRILASDYFRSQYSTTKPASSTSKPQETEPINEDAIKELIEIEQDLYQKIEESKQQSETNIQNENKQIREELQKLQLTMKVFTAIPS